MTNLYIHTIKLYNFKSFKGLNIIQPLDPFFNVIVGSNGSGKSNIIDSILFVLGYSAKSLRHKIITDVIYQNESQADYCFVEITFRHTEDLIIKRELRNKKSIYTINNKNVNANEINTVLKEYNIDNNRFLILQGEIESISMMKPKSGMLAYLEEIIGTNRYEDEVNKLNEEFERMNVNYDTKTTNYKFYEKEFNMLKNEHEENLNNINLHIKKIMAQLELDGYNHQLSTIRSKAFKTELNETNKKLKELETKNIKIKKDMCKAEESLTIKKTELAKMETELKIKRKVFYEIDTQNALYEDRKAKLEKNIEKLSLEIKNKTNENNYKDREREMLLKELEETKNNIKEMKIKVNIHKKEIEESEGKKAKLPETKKYKRLEKEFLALNSEKMEIENKILKFKDKTEFLENLKMQIKIHKGNKSKKDELNKHNEKQKKVKIQIQKIETNLRKYQSDLQRENYKLSEFTRKEYRNIKNNKINSILKPIPGFVGRLGDLGSAKEELDIAISTAGKGILNYMVVENTETAESCIELLKKSNIERTSFIVIDKISEYRLEGDFDYLLNHIQCDERYKKLFYFALGDTIICKNMKEATKIAMGKVLRKVVTFDGKMIDKSGLMSGGGALSGAMKIHNDMRCETENRIQKFESEIQKLLAEKETINETLNEITAKISELEKQIRFIDIGIVERKVKTIEIEIKDINLEMLESNLKTLSERFENIKNEMSQTESILENLDTMQIKQTKGEIGILFEKISIYENRQVDLKEKINKIKAFDINQYTIAIDTYTNEIKKMKRPEDYEKLKNEIKDLETHRDQITKGVNEIYFTIKEIKSKMGTDFDKEVEYRNTIDELNEQLFNDIRNIERIENTKKSAFEELNIFKDVVDISPIKDVETIEDQDILIETIKRVDQRHANTLKECNQPFDIKSVKEFINRNKEYSLFKNDYESYLTGLTKIKTMINDVTRKRMDEFTTGLKTINKHLKEIYQLITFGGNAELEYVDTMDPFSEGIILSVMPPKKSWKNVNMLSGGEKTISSLALVFALHAYKPSCFYVMDEIDAALDTRNVTVIANYIYEKAKNAQFLIVSLRNNMFELSDTIVGVFKNDGLSKALLFNTKNINTIVN